MKTKTTVFYNDTDCASFEATKNYLFETFAEEEGWTSPDDILDCVVYHEMDEDRRREWDDFRADVEPVFAQDSYLLTGTCGRWDGPAQGGKFIHSFCLLHNEFDKNANSACKRQGVLVLFKLV